LKAPSIAIWWKYSRARLAHQIFFFHGACRQRRSWAHVYYSNRIYEQSVKWRFFENDHFSKKAFGQMNFRSNVNFQKKLSVKLTFGQMNFRSNDFVLNLFSVKWHFLSKVDSVKWPFSEKMVIWPFGKMNFWSYGVRLNSDSVKWTFGQMVFRSNGLSV
jgi:hypothetical protein